MAVRAQHLRALQPYLIGERPREDTHEWDMFCPLHEDVKRSASLNYETSEWYCQACAIGGSVLDLIKMKDKWIDPPSEGRVSQGSRVRRREQKEEVTDAHVAGWASGLQSDDEALDWLVENRMLHTETLRTYEIGWDRDLKVYTIPIRGPEGELWNVRRYNPRPPEGRRKIWQVTGMVSRALYPLSSLTLAREGDGDIIIDEGEWDTLLNIQNGFIAITRTGAADVWLPNWSQEFEGLNVYVGHDCDDKGLIADRKVAKSVFPFAKMVRKLKLPFQHREKNGEDWTDFWGQYGAKDMTQLFESAIAMKEKKLNGSVMVDGPPIVSVLESFDSKRVGSPVKMLVTIKGKKEPGYTVPAEATLSCDQSAGTKCLTCAMNTAKGGEATVAIKPDDPVILEMLDATKSQVHDVIRRAYGAHKCPRLSIESDGHQAVEVLFGRPSIDHVDESQAGDYKNIKITSVGRHNTLPNNTVSIIGALQPNPRSQGNEFQAWQVDRQETSIDKFELTPESIKLMKMFQTTGQPIKKLAEISDELSKHVTRIYGRPLMHAMMDLVWHSVISWEFGGEMITRGWLEGLVIGDTQQGKSETARSLTRHYQAGEIVNCEAASFAGVVGGLQTFGNGKEWTVTWGAIPINDRRLVILEEVSGITPEQISQMSDIRSSGIAKLVKIQTEETYARTRLLWLGNPRNARMSDYTYGVQAIRPLIGNNEDIARFDMAMSVSLGEVDPADMNRPHQGGTLKYTSEACSTLLRWAWTRQPEHVVWDKGAEDAVYKAAMEVGAQYVEDPPLVQAANIRLKIARIAVAMAARLFSTDKEHEKVIVTVKHVKDAVYFLHKLYSMQGFGYHERSAELLADRRTASDNSDEMKQYLVGRKGLAKFLRNQGRFRRQDLEEILNLGREEANAIINTLWNARMVRKEGFEVVVEPTLHTLLREVKI